MEVKVRPALEKHGLEVASRLRDSDANELWLSHGFGPSEGVIKSMRAGGWSKAVIVDKQAEVIFGLSWFQGVDKIGCPWMLGTDWVYQHPVTIMRLAHTWVRAMREQARSLHNFVFVDNHRNISWLERLGFSMSPPIPFGPQGALFHPFHMRGKTCAEQHKP